MEGKKIGGEDKKKKPISARKLFWIILFSYIFVIALSISMAGYIYFNQKATDKELVETRERERLVVMRGRIQSRFQDVVSDLKMILDHHSLEEFIREPTEENRAYVVRDIKNFSTYRKIYDQIRYLDETGQEMIRVNLYDEGAFEVPEKDLQFKGDRYYFTDAFVLDEGEVFISPFDLNIEQGQIEQPLKPMIRIGTPVFIDGEKKGLLLMNYLGQEILEMTHSLESEDAQISLMNRDGYWLHTDGKEFEWGFMYENKLDETMAVKDPELWGELSQELCSGFYSEERGGLYCSVPIYPFVLAQKTTTGISEPFSPSLAELDPEERAWYLVVFIPDETLFKESFDIRNILTVIIAIWITVLGLMAMGINRSIKATMAARAEATQLNDVLRIITKTLRHDLANVFTGVRGLLDLYKDKKNEEHLLTANTECTRGIGIIDQMRQLERSVASGAILKPYRLKKTINDIARGYGITTIIKGNGVIMVDEAITAVFNNIIGNAVKHGSAKEIRVDIKRVKRKMIEIRITNYGKIIPAKDIGKIFDEGFTTGETGGTGMGLYIVRKTINRYGGTIHAENMQKPKGVSMVIIMPGKIIS